MSEYTPFKMKGFSGFGNSPAKQKTHPAGTGGKVKIAKEIVKKHFPKTYEKAQKIGRKVKVAADQIPYVGPSSSIYSTYAKAKKGTHMYDPKATINQPGYEKEKAQILKNKGWSTKKK